MTSQTLNRNGKDQGIAPVRRDDERVNILLVDDQPAKLLSYEAILSSLDENLIYSGSAREALEHLLKTDIAVILVDVCMPDLDGFELAALIRQHPRCQRTAIILVSAILMTEVDRLKGFEHGAVDYVPVPVIPEILRARVRVFAELYRKTRELEKLNRELESRVAERTSELEISTARLRESEDRLNLALDSAEAAPWVWELDSNLRNGSGRYHELYGFAPQENITVEKWLARVHPLDRERVVGRIEHMRAHPQEDTWSEEFRILHPTKGTRWLAGLGRAVRDSSGRLQRIIGISFDVTTRRYAQEERLSLLESERAARSEAERANRIKDQFLAMVSHELRAPLNGLLLWTELLRRNSKDSAVLAEGLEAIERSGRSQVRLIEDLLDMSRMRTGMIRINPEHVKLQSLLENVIATIRPLAEAKSIDVTLTMDPDVKAVIGDPTRLQQVFLNILSNAVKFTQKRGSVHVELAERNAHAETCIRDTGPGIGPEFLPHIFDPFRQEDSSGTRQHAGLGLGLAIAKHLVELHQGEIEVENMFPETGARFTVRLPSASPRRVAAGTATALAEDFDFQFRDTRILVVDDDPDTCHVLWRLLTEAGAQVETALSVDDAMGKIERLLPEVIISDIGMPEKDGHRLIRSVRQHRNAALSSVRALAVTAFVRPEDRILALEAGFDAYLPKPIERNTLFKTLAALLAADRRSP